MANVHILQQINWKGLSEISIRRAFFHQCNRQVYRLCYDEVRVKYSRFLHPQKVGMIAAMKEWFASVDRINRETVLGGIGWNTQTDQ